MVKLSTIKSSESPDNNSGDTESINRDVTGRKPRNLNSDGNKMFVLLLIKLPFSFRPFHKYSALEIGKRAASVRERGPDASHSIFFLDYIPPIQTLS